MTNTKADIEIKLDGARASLIVNGADISNKVRKYTLTQEAGELPVLTVEMNAISTSVAGGCVAELPKPWKDFYIPMKEDGCIDNGKVRYCKDCHRCENSKSPDESGDGQI